MVEVYYISGLDYFMVARWVETMVQFCFDVAVENMRRVHILNVFATQLVCLFRYGYIAKTKILCKLLQYTNYFKNVLDFLECLLAYLPTFLI